MRTQAEINFDGLVGPTHNYAGLSSGNLASMGSHGQVSNPRGAALQGLRKMRTLLERGIPQAILPPHARPALSLARELGFSGSDESLVEVLHRQQPRLLAYLYSASSMWVANSGVVSPSADTEDGKVHFSPANLVAKLHRSLEPAFTHRVFKRIFAADCFEVHAPLPSHPALGDEGAANHERLSVAGGGVEVFVWGREALGPERGGKFSARQTDLASESLARRHRIKPGHGVFVQQSAQAIDAGAFHNDVVAVAHGNTLLFHEFAFEDTTEVLAELRQKLSDLGGELKAVEIPDRDLPLERAISTYLFNSQLVTANDGKKLLIAPVECDEDPTVKALIEGLMASRAKPFDEFVPLNLKESMKNGGGPGCLRLRVTLTDQEARQVHSGVLLTSEKLDSLESWVERHYRDRLSAEDLGDPRLVREVREALSELETLLDLRGLYGLA